MPRKSRIDAPGALQHIIIRGIERSNIFRDEKDKNVFLMRFGKVLLETSTPSYAWTLMDNPFAFAHRIDAAIHCNAEAVDRICTLF
jgi:REP-associated tyrosine transposase